MNNELLTNLGTLEPDNLIARVTPPAEAFGVFLAAGAGLVKRGTLLGTASDGFLAPYDSESDDLTVNCILADDVDTGDDDTADPVAAVAYRSGCFNRAAVIGEMAAEDEDALRKYGIVFFDPA